jgi:hypothetical protein
MANSSSQCERLIRLSACFTAESKKKEEQAFVKSMFDYTVYCLVYLGDRDTFAH